MITNLIFPGAFYSDGTSLDENNTAFVGRYSRSFGDASSFGALITSREGDDYYNRVGGADLHWKISDQHSVDMQYLGSDTRYPDEVAVDFDQPLSSFTGEALYASYDYDSRNWFAHVEHQDLDKGFRADSGFIPQVDVEWQLLRGGRVWHGAEDNWWTRMNLVGVTYVTHDGDGRMIDRANNVSYGVGGPMQSWTEVGYQRGDFLWDDILFEVNETYFFTRFRPRGGLSLKLFVSTGSQIDFANSQLGDQVLIEPSVDWNINRHLLLTMEGNLVNFDSKEGAQIFDASVYNLRLTWQFNRRSFLRLTTQYQDVERNVDEYIDDVDAKTRSMGRQLLFSYKINPQTVFFLGYSDNLYEDDTLDTLEKTDRTWFMKIGYAWTP